MWAMWILDSNLRVKRSTGWVNKLCHGSHMVNRKLISDPHKLLRSAHHTLSICYGKMLEITRETKLYMLFPIFSDDIKLLLFFLHVDTEIYDSNLDDSCQKTLQFAEQSSDATTSFLYDNTAYLNSKIVWDNNKQENHLITLYYIHNSNNFETKCAKKEIRPFISH